jgi:hypothetical protein
MKTTLKISLCLVVLVAAVVFATGLMMPSPKYQVGDHIRMTNTNDNRTYVIHERIMDRHYSSLWRKVWVYKVTLPGHKSADWFAESEIRAAEK